MNYLPSKKFIIILLSLISIGLSGAIIVKHFSQNQVAGLFTGNGNNAASLQTVTLASLIDKDSNGDGIPDWEKALWGIDPTKKQTHPGISDIDWIQEQQALLAKDSSSTSSSTDASVTSTDLFARELFATIISLDQSGDLNDQNLGTVSDQLKQEVAAKQELPNLYNADNLKVVSANASSRSSYKETLTTVIGGSAYQDVGTELDVIGRYVDNQTATDQNTLTKISKEYTSLAVALSHISVPQDALSIHLEMINDYANIGIALRNVTDLYTDPLTGLIGIGQYKLYTDDLTQVSSELGTYISSNDIL